MRKLSVILILLAGEAAAWAQGTAFIYQGHLTDGNREANGIYSFHFDIVDAVTNGNAVGTAITKDTVTVSNGLFSVSLDFGPGIFTGPDRWLDIGVKSNGVAGAYTQLTPCQPLSPWPYAMFAASAGVAGTAMAATTATTVANNAVTSATVQDFSLMANDVANGQMVKSLNGLHDDISLIAGVNVLLTPSGNQITLSSPSWSLQGNKGTSATNFLGTTDSHPLDLKANGRRGFHLAAISQFYGSSGLGGMLDFWEYAMNVVGGHEVNTVSNSVMGATIAGGGYLSSMVSLDLDTPHPNLVTDDFGTIGGGYDNTAGQFATVPGGINNDALGKGSLAAGRNAHTSYDGSFIWGDGTRAVQGTGSNRFEVLATGGVNLWTGTNAIWSDSQKGISLAAGDQPLITRSWDIFNKNAGNKAGLGRWGLFMEPYEMVLGIPGNDIAGRTFSVAKYNQDGTRQSLMTVNQDGNLTCKTLTILGGADLAEPFAVSENNLAAGAVVVIDEKNPGHLKLSRKAYDRKVAGVVSGAKGIQPGISMIQAEKLEAGRNVALSGRVYVQADASYGRIEPGDLLTTSDTPGYAQKVSDYSQARGATLGKAMSVLEEGRGLVLVLITLQ